MQISQIGEILKSFLGLSLEENIRWRRIKSNQQSETTLLKRTDKE